MAYSKDYYKTPDWQRQRRAIWNRANKGRISKTNSYCEHCGKDCCSNEFEVHHMTYDFNMFDKPEDLTKLRGLCSKPENNNCHDYYHGRQKTDPKLTQLNKTEIKSKTKEELIEILKEIWGEK